MKFQTVPPAGASHDCSAHRRSTTAGLFIALFSLPALALLFRTLAGTPMDATYTLMREFTMFVALGTLFYVICMREHSPLSSIGASFDNIGKSALWSILGMLFCAVGMAIAFGAIQLFNFPKVDVGPATTLPLWITGLVILRAAVVEEIFYRGYAIERLQSITGSKWIAVVLPLTIFTLSHYSSGPAMMILVFGGAAALTLFYLWRRDLLANIFAHFLVNAVPNLLLPIFSDK